jgi:hypothetical protein
MRAKLLLDDLCSRRALVVYLFSLIRSRFSARFLLGSPLEAFNKSALSPVIEFIESREFQLLCRYARDDDAEACLSCSFSLAVPSVWTLWAQQNLFHSLVEQKCEC